MVSATPLAADVSATVHGVRAVTVDSSAQLELGFNTVAPAVRDPAVRRGLTAAVDPEVVGRIVTGQSDPAVTTYPFPPGSASTTTGDGAAVERARRDAGFTRTGARWERDDDPLSVSTSQACAVACIHVPISETA